MHTQICAGRSFACVRHRRFNVKAFLVLAIVAAVSLVSSPVFAQVNTGRILGTVTDQSGGVIAGAMVTVTNTATGVARTLTTDQAGEYNAPTLTPGTYSVRATSMGFQTFERQNIAVGVGQDARVDAQLTPGQVTQTVEVTAAAPLLDTTSAVVSGTIETQTIVDLPMNGRNFQNLLVLRPGVVSTPGGGTLTTSTNGLQPQDNNYVYEGLDSNDPFTGQGVTNTTLPFGDAATILPIDAIQELNVETNAPAEFGRRPGAVINIGIKSGGNTIHGSAYAFGRDGAWDAIDFINPPSTTPPQPVQLEQWGATVGGPILKNKLFYFAGFERQSYSVGNLFTEQIPTSASIGDPSQSIPDAENFLTTHGIAVNPLSVKLLPLYGSNTGPTSAFSAGFPDVVASNNGIGKLDYHINDHHAISGSYFYGTGTALGEDGVRTQPEFRQQGSLTSEFLTTSWTWTPNSTWVNDVRFGWNRYNRFLTVADSQTPATSYGMNTGITNPLLGGLPTIKVSGFSQLGADQNSPKSFGPGNDYDLVDHVSFLRGKHAFKFGGEFLTYRGVIQQYNAGRGIFNFTKKATANGVKLNGLESFLAGLPDPSLGATLLEGNPTRTLSQSDFSGFFEDSWRATQKLTVNMGLRYEYFTPLSEINNLIGTFSPQVGFEQQGVNISHPYNPDYKNISPRLGIAWDVTGKGTTVVRAGFGLYYNQEIAAQLALDTTLPGSNPGITSIPTAFPTYLPNGAAQAPLNPTNGMGSTAVGFPGANLNWNLAGTGGPIFPAASATALACGNGLPPVNPVAGAPATNPGPCSVLFTSPNLPSPRITSWNLGIQHALTPTLSVEADYIGNHGSRLTAITDLNQVNPNSPAEIACGHCDQITDLPYYSKFPYLQYIDQMTDTAISNYNALQATLTARNFHNLSFIVGYTYSHALDDLAGGGNFHIANPENSLNPMGDYGASDFDVRHHFSFTPTYNIPGKKSPGQMLQGWVLSSSILIESGQPWSPLDSNDASGVGEFQDRWDFFGNPNDFNATFNAIPFYPAGGPMPATCLQAAAAAGAAATLANGCYASGPGARSVMIAPAPGNFGTMARNMFYGPHFADWDFSVFKNWKFKERLTAQFRAEFFNILNHPIYANPNSVGTNDPSSGGFGCACETPDVASTNPVLGTGAAREIQLGLKLLF
jgi:hypothetical protein